MNPLLYTFYGDDVTGSTDVLEQLAEAGVPAALFFTPPTADDLAAFPHVRALGVAGTSRSQTPEWMSRELPPVFRALHGLRAPIAHYKVCSTFDSSPETGSIGRALELGLEVWRSRYAPVVVGAPHLKRFVHEGRLFAADPHGDIHRIDRHPMSRHPVTPMREPRLARHLAAQTALAIAEARTCTEATAAAARGARAVILDAVSEADLQDIGECVWQQALREPLFAIGSSGLTRALIHAWRAAGLTAGERLTPTAHQHGGPLLVLSGSCAAATERQLLWAARNGFAMLPVAPADLTAGRTDALAAAASTALAQGRHTVLYTSLGAPAQGSEGGEQLGRALGHLLRAVAPVGRVLLCGGDTSSHALAALGLRALTWAAPLTAGAPICRAHAPGKLDGLELVLKGGQMGPENLFQLAAEA